MVSKDKQEISQLVEKFFSVFDNQKGRTPELNGLRKLLIPEAIIIKNLDRKPEVYSVDSFIEPREKLLTSGELIEFSEQEVSAKTDVFGAIAQRFCIYKKSGVMAGKKFEVYGKKTIQLIKVGERWRISAVAWDDEREGLQVEDRKNKCADKP